jgi:hypothetical protein
MTRIRLRKPSFVPPAFTLLLGIGLVTQPAAAQQPGSAKANRDRTVQAASPTTASASEKTAADAGQLGPSSLQDAIQRIAASGQVLQIGETSSSRLTPAFRLAPGAPPILAFRYLDGQARHRFGDLDLVMDDAGH